MMNRARQKLNSSSGASLLLAMLFFLFCFTIGAIVLTAATANAGKTAHIREEQQSYLAVQSAARLLRNDLNGMTLQGSYTDTDTSSYSVTVDPDGNSTSTPSSSTSSRVPNLPATLSDSGLRTLLEKDLIDFFFGNNSVPGYAKPSQPKEYRSLESGRRSSAPGGLCGPDPSSGGLFHRHPAGGCKWGASHDHNIRCGPEKRPIDGHHG